MARATELTPEAPGPDDTGAVSHPASAYPPSYTRRVTTSTTDPLIGRLIDGRYQVRSRIARGGMATVYLATDLRLERRVAVKVMHGHLADDSQFKQRFIQEARSAARLAHPNVVNVFDQGQDGESAYLVMEYLSGITLRDLLQQHGSLTTEQTLDITEAVLAGLAAAHHAGIVHRDLKPENVLLADDGRIKIGDFGLARAASANTATGAALLGTIAYLSPELVTRGIADARSDIYAVGIMMYEMLTGEQPFKGEQPMQIAYQHANDSVPPPSNANPQVPAELDELVLWATARDPEERPRDARVMLDQLRDTEALLSTALPTGATAIQKTMVLPSALQNTAETQVLGARSLVAAHADTAPVSPNAAKLSANADSRRKRGWVAFILVLVLAIAAGGTGWWFGAGPGAHVTIPEDIVAMQPDTARAQLTELGINVADGFQEVNSVSIAEGLVAGSDPAPGSSIRRDTVVTLKVSLGPAPTVIGVLAGLSLPAAVQAIADAKLALEEPVEYRFSDQEKDIVLGASVADVDVSAGSDALFEGQTVRLVVSAGALPSVAGMSVDEATAALTEAGLEVDPAPQSNYSEEIAKGAVISVVALSDVVRPGDRVILNVSEGREPISVPNIIGTSWKEAKSLLSGAGLAYDFEDDGVSRTLAQSFPESLITVKSADPGASATAFRGDTVTVGLRIG